MLTGHASTFARNGQILTGRTKGDNVHGRNLVAAHLGNISKMFHWLILFEERTYPAIGVKG